MRRERRAEQRPRNSGELVVSCGDAAEVLEPAKAAFDDISASVGAFVETMNDDTVGFIGNDALGTATSDFGAKVVPVVPFVCEKRERQNIGRGSDVGILTGVKCRTTGRQSGSLSAWIFVVRPPRERPIAWLCSPFSAGGTPMSFNRSRVERPHDGILARFGQCLKDCAPSFAFGPAIEAIVDHRVRTVFARTITPSRA
ncbi:hypothetical protein ABIB68_007333 [Bradyrhizobium sp. F1.2.2]